MEHLHFQALEHPISRLRSRVETFDVTIVVAPDLCVGRRFSERSVKGEVNCSFTYVNLNKILHF
jgi:hypothetical protein